MSGSEVSFLSSALHEAFTAGVPDLSLAVDWTSVVGVYCADEE